MTKRQFIKVLVVANLLLVGLVAVVGVGGWFWLNRYSSNQQANQNNSSQQQAGSLVLGLTAFDSPVLLYRKSDNLIRILVYKSTLDYQEVFQIEQSNSTLPVETQLLNLDNQSIAYVVADFDTQTVRRYTFNGEAQDIFRTNGVIKSIWYQASYLYTLVNLNDNYQLYRSDLLGQELKLLSFSNTESLYLTDLNSTSIILKVNNTTDCYQIDWTNSSPVLEAKTTCPNIDANVNSEFQKRYQLFTRYQTSIGTLLPESSSGSYPTSYPESYPESYSKLVLRQYIYTKAEVQKVLNLNPLLDDLGLNQALIGQSYLVESQADFRLEPIFVSEQVTLLLEVGINTNEKNLLAIYPDTKVERMRLPVFSELDYLGGSNEQTEFFFVTKTSINGIERAGIISFELKNRTLKEYGLPQCQPSVISCNAGILPKSKV